MTEKEEIEQPASQLEAKKCIDDFRFCEKVVYLDEEGQVVLGNSDESTARTLMLGVSDDTELFDSYTDGNTIIFITRSNIFYRYPEGMGAVGYGPSILAVHSFDLTNNLVDTLFTSNDTDNTYIRINPFDTSERVWNFSVYGCWNCGAGHPQTYLYDSKDKSNSKTIGHTLDFEMISQTEYRYRIYNPDPASDENVICEAVCVYLSTDHLPWVYGSIEDN